MACEDLGSSRLANNDPESFGEHWDNSSSSAAQLSSVAAAQLSSATAAATQLISSDSGLVVVT